LLTPAEHGHRQHDIGGLDLVRRPIFSPEINDIGDVIAGQPV
jgi:hypothetical protein